jgi:hypothetical protein
MKFAATHEVDRLCGRRTETKMNGYRSVQSEVRCCRSHGAERVVAGNRTIEVARLRINRRRGGAGACRA